MHNRESSNTVLRAYDCYGEDQRKNLIASTSCYSAQCFLPFLLCQFRIILPLQHKRNLENHPHWFHIPYGIALLTAGPLPSGCMWHPGIFAETCKCRGSGDLLQESHSFVFCFQPFYSPPFAVVIYVSAGRLTAGFSFGVTVSSNRYAAFP